MQPIFKKGCGGQPRILRQTDTSYDKGLAEGRSEGLAEGRAAERLSNARSLKENGVPLDLIAKSLGLTDDELQQL